MTTNQMLVFLQQPIKCHFSNTISKKKLGCASKRHFFHCVTACVQGYLSYHIFYTVQLLCWGQIELNNDRYATVLVDILEIRKIIVGSGSSYIAIASGLLCLAMSDFGIIESDERRICCYSTVTRVHILEFRVVFHIRLVFNKYF